MNKGKNGDFGLKNDQFGKKIDRFSHFFKRLFDEGDCTCFGDRFSISVSEAVPDRYHEFFCINPLSSEHDYGFVFSETRDFDKPRRADINVCACRNFLFEMDTLDLDSQLKLLIECKIPWTSIVYSGGKSYHAILSLEKPLELEYHTDSSADTYKYIWKRIAAYMDSIAQDKFGVSNAVDPSSKNPSRLSRFPNSRRDNGNFQKLLHLGSRISEVDFNDLIEKCPEVSKEVVKAVMVDEPAETSAEFWQVAPIGLRNELKYPWWIADAGVYPHLYRVTLWAIDTTDIPKEEFLKVLDYRTFGLLLEAGYPERKLTVAIDSAYKNKRRG